MFDQLKQLAQLKKIKDALEKEKKEIEKEGVKVVVNGKMEVEEIKLNYDLPLEKQERVLKECLNEAFKEIQKEAALKIFQ